jgi:CheY-like chemotaxis protein
MLGTASIPLIVEMSFWNAADSSGTKSSSIHELIRPNWGYTRRRPKKTYAHYADRTLGRNRMLRGALVRRDAGVYTRGFAMINHSRGLSQQEPCTVLVVEDEPLVRLMVAEELRDSGMRVIEAGTADEALERLRAGNPVDFVFADIELPGSMNGLELARRVQIDFPNLKLLMTSSRAQGHVFVASQPFHSETL